MAASQEWLGDLFSRKSHTWDQISFLKKHWDGPIVLKGIQHVADARLAVEAGVQGIIVSNHGGKWAFENSKVLIIITDGSIGRQLDGAIGSLEALPEVVAAVGNELTVLFDSGIRTGADVMKALALGAKAVLVGRPAIYGLAIGGKQGAKAVLQGLLADLDQSMALAGVAKVQQCNKSIMRRVQYGGDLKASL